MHAIPHALVVLLSSVALAADSADQNARPHTIMYLSDAGPIVIEVRVLVDGRPLDEAWEQYVDGLYASLDADQSGELSVDEAARLPTPNVLQQAGLIVSPGNSPRASAPDSRPRDGRVTRDELAAYLKAIGGGPFSTTITQRGDASGRIRYVYGQGAPADLFKLLDRDGDKRLSAEEFAFDDGLLKLDRDDDRALSQSELASYSNPYLAVRMMQGNIQTQPEAFIALESVSGLAEVRRLMERFDGKSPAGATEAGVEKDNVLTAAELGMSPAALAPYDADGSGGLDYDELRQWFRQPQGDVKLLVRVDAQRNEVNVSLAAESTSRGFELRSSSGAAANVLAVGKTRLEFDAVWPAADPKQQILDEFKRADADGNGYVDQQESRRFFMIGQLFSLLDADGDEKLFQPEAEAWADRWAAAFRCRVALGVADQGRKLFDILDANHDGRLGEIELRAGAARIADWDANDDDALAEEEIPGTWSVSLAPVGVGGSRPSVVRGNQVRRLDEDGPNWFRRMDRNGDGLVARREFLGPLADFTRLDADQNGYLAVDEAAAESE
jgi:Ca2+-binding EF-hand superfamily protein